MQFTGNPLTVIPKQMFAGLRESPLVSLYLDNCFLQEIDEEAFIFLKNLQILNLSENPSTLVNPPEKLSKILQPLTSLTNLYLSGLGFSEFPVEALSHISNLKVLDISKSNFHTIKQEALSKLSNLEELYIDNSKIQIIDPNVFVVNSKLKALSLRMNNIQQVSSDFPPSLTWLSLTNQNLNSVRTVPIKFKNLENLKFLEVNSIKIANISKNTFEGLSKLETIYHKECGVENIEDGAFKDLANLQVLILDNNPISELRPETFMGLEKLETLSLQYCQLSFPSISTLITANQTNSTSLETSPFDFLSNIKTLNLTGNKIAHVPATLFQNLPQLCYISLDNNPIESWETRIFQRFTPVYDDEFNTITTTNTTCYAKLRLANCSLAFMKTAMLEDFRGMWEIDFSNNVLVCNDGACKFRDILASVASSNPAFKQEWVNSNSYKCKDLRTSSLVKIIDLTDEICSRNAAISPTLTSSSSSGAKITIISVMASLSLVAAVLILLAYKNRAHLRYFWFAFKFNVIPLSPRKAKLSTMEDPSSSSNSSYDYDVFISYHHDDSGFIEDVFLPEIEIRDENGRDEAGVVEARNFIYMIENDEMIKSNNNNVLKAKQSTPRFKVCLHERDFAAGIPITENIVDCVDRSRKTVIFVSKQYMESQWCSYELNLVYHRLVESRRKAFVLVLLEPVPAAFRSKVLNYLMVSKTHLQWPGMDGFEEDKASFWRKLRAFLQSS